MSKQVQEGAFNVICNSSTNIGEVQQQIENIGCNSDENSKLDFSLRGCNPALPSFMSLINSMLKHVFYCWSESSASNTASHISHIDIWKNMAMGVEGIKYLVKSACNLFCNFARQELLTTLDKPLDFIITFINNTLIDNNFTLDGCPNGELIAETYGNTTLHMLFIEHNKLSNNSCSAINSINDNSPNSLVDYYADSTNTSTIFLILGGVAVGGGILLVALIANKCMDLINNYSPLPNAIHSCISSKFSNAPDPELLGNATAEINAEGEEII